MYNARLRKRGRVVEGSSLENCRRGNPFVSSNLTASARKQRNRPRGGFLLPGTLRIAYLLPAQRGSAARQGCAFSFQLTSTVRESAFFSSDRKAKPLDSTRPSLFRTIKLLDENTGDRPAGASRNRGTESGKRMRLLISLILPWLTFFTIGRPFAGIICLILQLTVIGWLPAAIWAVYALGQYKTDQKIAQAARERG